MSDQMFVSTVQSTQLYTFSVANDIALLADALHDELLAMYGASFLEDGVYSYLKNIRAFEPPMYKPTLQDVLLCRSKTTGINAHEYTRDNIKYQLCDGNDLVT